LLDVRALLLAVSPLANRIELIRLFLEVDRYGRILRYIKRGGLNLNVELVRRGAAAPYFYGGERGRYASALMAAAVAAKAQKRGLWGACPSTPLDPNRAIHTGTSGPPTTNPPPSGKCDPNYSGVACPHVRLT
jgi:endonuclease YncB( thermonuclease family)